MDKLIIKRRRMWRYTGISKVAKALGVTDKAVYQYASAGIKSLSAEKRARIKIIEIEEESK